MSTNADIARQIGAAMNEAEAALARIDALATEAFRACLDPDQRAKAEAQLKRARKAAGGLHRALAKAAKGSGDVTVQSSGDGK